MEEIWVINFLIRNQQWFLSFSFFLSFLFFSFSISRSSHWRCSVRKGVPRNFAKFIGKHLCHGLFLKKVAGLGVTFIKKETLAQVFSCKFCKISKKTFFTEHLWVTASVFRENSAYEIKSLLFMRVARGVFHIFLEISHFKLLWGFVWKKLSSLDCQLLIEGSLLSGPVSNFHKLSNSST